MTRLRGLRRVKKAWRKLSPSSRISSRESAVKGENLK